MRIFGLVLCALAVLVLVALGFRAWRQHVEAKAQTIGSGGFVHEGFVAIEGIEQWVSVRGEDRRNPILVIVHGGPGASLLPTSYATLRAWERHFTIVQWEQRGSGRTFGRNGSQATGALSIARLADDGVAVTRWATQLLGQRKAIVFGLSWGTVLAMEMATREPELYAAYIGSGQIVDMPRNEEVAYSLLMARLTASGADSAARDLAAIGPPPHRSVDALLASRKILIAHPPASEASLNRQMVMQLLSAPHYGLGDIRDWVSGQFFSIKALADEMLAYRGAERFAGLPMPVIVIQGEQDIQTPTSLVQDQFERSARSNRRMTIIPGGGHSVALAMPQTVLEELNASLRAVAPAAFPSMATGAIPDPSS